MCDEYGLHQKVIPPESWIFALVAAHSLLQRNREVSLDKIRSVGFKEERALGEGHFAALDRLVTSKMLPPREKMQKSA